jgi:hypothetical protein
LTAFSFFSSEACAASTTATLMLELSHPGGSGAPLGRLHGARRVRVSLRASRALGRVAGGAWRGARVCRRPAGGGRRARRVARHLAARSGARGASSLARDAARVL